MITYPSSELNDDLQISVAKTLKRKCCHFDEIFVIGCTESYQNDNFECSQWWKFRQNDDISLSVFKYKGAIINTYRKLHSENKDQMNIFLTHFSSSEPLNTFMATYVLDVMKSVTVFKMLLKMCSFDTVFRVSIHRTECRSLRRKRRCSWYRRDGLPWMSCTVNWVSSLC